MSNSLLETLKNRYPDYKFCSSKRFSFRPPRTILFNPDDPNFNSLLLHELGHATLNHHDFKTDITRLKMERAAWDQAIKIATELDITIDDALIEEELDSYRNWLHQRSKCKKCGLTCYQTPDGVYHCPHCEQK